MIDIYIPNDSKLCVVPFFQHYSEFADLCFNRDYYRSLTVDPSLIIKSGYDKEMGM